MNGYWTTFGAKASIDWCEPNYVHNHFVAEWWNTLSSLWLVVIGLYGLWWSWRQRADIEPRFRVCFAVLAVVGAGSAGFHGTMLKAGQAFDELPMVLGGMALLYCMMVRHPESAGRERRWQLGMLGYCLLFLMGHFSLENYFVWFLWTYSALVTMMVFLSVRLSFGPSGSPTHRRLVVAAAGLYVGGVVFFWVPEHLLLSCDHPLQQLQLHSGWHLLAGTGTYFAILFALYDRQRLKGLAPKLDRRRWILNVVGKQAGSEGQWAQPLETGEPITTSEGEPATAAASRRYRRGPESG